jgi:hypothetical protein
MRLFMKKSNMVYQYDDNQLMANESRDLCVCATVAAGGG